MFLDVSSLCWPVLLFFIPLSLFLDVFLLLSFLLFHHLPTSIPLSWVYFLHQVSSGPGERAQSVKSLLSVTTWVWSPELTKKPGVDSVHLQPCAGGTGRRTLGTLASDRHTQGRCSLAAGPEIVLCSTHMPVLTQAQLGSVYSCVYWEADYVLAPLRTQEPSVFTASV